MPINDPYDAADARIEAQIQAAIAEQAGAEQAEIIIMMEEAKIADIANKQHAVDREKFFKNSKEAKELAQKERNAAKCEELEKQYSEFVTWRNDFFTPLSDEAAKILENEEVTLGGFTKDELGLMRRRKLKRLLALTVSDATGHREMIEFQKSGNCININLRNALHFQHIISTRLHDLQNTEDISGYKVLDEKVLDQMKNLLLHAARQKVIEFKVGEEFEYNQYNQWLTELTSDKHLSEAIVIQLELLPQIIKCFANYIDKNYQGPPEKKPDAQELAWHAMISGIDRMDQDPGSIISTIPLKSGGWRPPSRESSEAVRATESASGSSTFSVKVA